MSLLIKRRQDNFAKLGHRKRLMSYGQLEAALLNAQRTVQAFRAAYSEETLALVRTADKFFDEAQQLTRERDNARAALEECQKLNATLREELELKLEINRRHCDDWADDDTAIRNIAAKFIPQAWINGDTYYVPSMVTCVEKVAEQLAAVTNENATLREEVSRYKEQSNAKQEIKK
jgi:hypothetical protein